MFVSLEKRTFSVAVFYSVVFWFCTSFMAKISKPSYRTAIHLNLGGDLNSSGQSSSNYETEDSCGEEDSKLAQFQRVFKHLEVKHNLINSTQSLQLLNLFNQKKTRLGFGDLNRINFGMELDRVGTLLRIQLLFEIVFTTFPIKSHLFDTGM